MGNSQVSTSRIPTLVTLDTNTYLLTRHLQYLSPLRYEVLVVRPYPDYLFVYVAVTLYRESQEVFVCLVMCRRRLIPILLIFRFLFT